jgi:hypothetical protein
MRTTPVFLRATVLKKEVVPRCFLGKRLKVLFKDFSPSI